MTEPTFTLRKYVPDDVRIVELRDRLTAGLGGPRVVVDVRYFGSHNLRVEPADAGEHPGLFRTFIEMALDESGLRDFVSKHGSLTATMLMPGEVNEDDAVGAVLQEQAGIDPRRILQLLGDPVDLVLRHARAMRAAWRLWESLVAGDMDSVRAHFAWVKLRGELFDCPNDDHGLGGDVPAPFRYVFEHDAADREDLQAADDPSTNLTLTTSGPEGVVVEDLRDAPRVVVDDATARASGRALLANVLGHVLERNMEVRVEWSDEVPVTQYAPSCLLAALWLQAQQAMVSKASFKSCVECGMPFEVSKNGRRRQATYCSNACKSRHQRVKQERIEALLKTDTATADIAAKVGVSTNVVQAHSVRLAKVKRTS